MEMKNKYIQIITFCFLLVVPFQAFAQSSDNRIIERDQPSRYFLGKDEQLLLPVNILGLVKKPGQYMVPFRTDLITLIAYAGGFTEDAKISEIKIISNTEGEKSNADGKKPAKVFTVDIKKYFETGDRRHVPQLQPDDTIVVKGSAARTVNKIFGYLQNLAIVAQIAFYIVVIKDNNK